MKREELVAMGLTDEQIEKIMADYGKTVQNANKVAEKYKADAEKMADLQKQLDDINNANLTELEKANKSTEEALSKVAELEKQIARTNTERDLATIGIVGEEAEKIIASLSEGKLDVATLGTIFTAREEKAVSEYAKKTLDDTPNPKGGNPKEDTKTEAEKFVERMVGANNNNDSSQTSASIIDAYK